ncbi:hypothetical protein Mapa_013032 [Marchantia paleacea]|nr:hypothetical protein Mapa_013032 [Marchantia paleacea]
MPLKETRGHCSDARIPVVNQLDSFRAHNRSNYAGLDNASSSKGDTTNITLPHDRQLVEEVCLKCPKSGTLSCHRPNPNLQRDQGTRSQKIRGLNQLTRFSRRRQNGEHVKAGEVSTLKLQEVLYCKYSQVDSLVIQVLLYGAWAFTYHSLDTGQ